VAFDGEGLTVRASARRVAADAVRVELRPVPETAGLPIIEATVRVGTAYPVAPAAPHLALLGERPSRFRPAALYTQGMFHGPAFRGVLSVDRWGEDGVEATLGALPVDGLVRGRPQPAFAIDPVVLDAAGQLVGYWIADHMETGFNVFPYQVDALELFGPPLAAPERATGRARIALVGEGQVRADIDVVDAAGRVRMRLTGWQDRRFDLPRGLYRLRIAPRAARLSDAWPAPLAGLPLADALRCARVEGAWEETLQAGGAIWERVLAHLVLARRERPALHLPERPARRRTEWLLGRAAAKDAARDVLAQRCGVACAPADVLVLADDRGRPVVEGAWASAAVPPPLVSVAHVDGFVAAVAADARAVRAVGIDVERLGRVRPGFERLAFTAEERAALAARGDAGTGEWALRYWCAKEAAGKALGTGLGGRPQDFVVGAADDGGALALRVEGTAAAAEPWARRGLTAHTSRQGDVVVAIIACGKE
jgi:phosphopantetheinyl transferase